MKNFKKNLKNWQKCKENENKSLREDNYFYFFDSLHLFIQLFASVDQNWIKENEPKMKYVDDGVSLQMIEVVLQVICSEHHGGVVFSTAASVAHEHTSVPPPRPSWLSAVGVCL